MSVHIHNLGPTDSNKDEDPEGWHLYEVCVGEKRLGTFKHERRQGLRRCLLKASRVVQRRPELPEPPEIYV